MNSNEQNIQGKKHLNAGYVLLLISEEHSAKVPHQWPLITQDVAKIERVFKMNLTSVVDQTDKLPEDMLRPIDCHVRQPDQ